MKKLFLISSLIIMSLILFPNNEENTIDSNVQKQKNNLQRKISSKENKVIAHIVKIEGLVFKKDKNDKTFLNKKSKIYEGDIIQTKSKSFVKLVMIDQTSLNVGPNSEIELSEFKMPTPQTRTNIITLLYGVVKSHFHMKNKVDGLYVKTPTVSMGVRGTEFITKYMNQQTEMYLISGKVDVIKNNNISNVAPKQYYSEKTNTINTIDENLHHYYENILEDTPKEEVQIDPTYINHLLKQPSMKKVSQQDADFKFNENFSPKSSNSIKKSNGPEVYIPKEESYRESIVKERVSQQDKNNSNNKKPENKKQDRKIASTSSVLISNSISDRKEKKETDDILSTSEVVDESIKEETSTRSSDSLVDDNIGSTREEIIDNRIDTILDDSSTIQTDESVIPDVTETQQSAGILVNPDGTSPDTSSNIVEKVVDTTTSVVDGLLGGGNNVQTLCSIDSFIYYGFEADFITIQELLPTLDQRNCVLKIKGEDPYNYNILLKGSIVDALSDSNNYILSIEGENTNYKLYSDKNNPELFKIIDVNSSTTNTIEYLPGMFYVEEHCPCQ